MTAKRIATIAKLKSRYERLLHRNIRVIPLRIIHITYNRLECRKLDSLLRSNTCRVLKTQPGISYAPAKKENYQKTRPYYPGRTPAIAMRKSYFVMFVGLMLLMLLAACGANPSASSS